MGLSWRKRLDADQPIALPTLDLGPALLSVAARRDLRRIPAPGREAPARPFVMTLGYGDAATGYIPTASRSPSTTATSATGAGSTRPPRPSSPRASRLALKAGG